MTPLQKIALTHLCLLIELLPMSAQSPKPATLPPVPAPILAAKKIFIANANTEQPWDETAQFAGGPDRAYTQFYFAMKAWGRYDLADSPADADLLLEIGFSCPPSGAAERAVSDSLAGRLYDPQFRVVIRDPKTNALLWTFAERAQWALLRGNRDKNFDAALDHLVSDLQALAGSPSAASAAKPQ